MSSLNLPNPETPLAFLPPTAANQLEVSRYIYVATLGAFVWDILSNLPKDYALLTKYRFTPATATYFSSRIAALAYVTTSTVFQIGAVGNCQGLQIALGICFLFAVPLTSLLFFLRIRAIFVSQPILVGCFLFLWSTVLACCILVPFAIHGAHIGTTDHCINTLVKPFSSAGIIASTVHDTCVLVAISARILYNASVEDSFESRFKSFWEGGGKALPRFSKSILQSGQQYYLITVSGNLITMIMILTPSVPPVYHAMFTIPNVAIENAMACKVFRDIKFGLIDSAMSTDVSSRTLNANAGINPKATFGSTPLHDLERGGGRRRGRLIEEETFELSVSDKERTTIGSVGSAYPGHLAHEHNRESDWKSNAKPEADRTGTRGATELVVDLKGTKRGDMKSKADSALSRLSLSYSEEEALK